MRMKKKLLFVIIAFAAISLLGILWITMPIAAQLSFSLRIYCASAAADENAVNYLTDNGRSLIFANKESLQFLSKMALNGELVDETNYYDLYARLLPDYYIGDWEIGRNEALFYWHFGRLYSISPRDDVVRQDFQELIDNAKQTYQDESGQTRPFQADRVEILHETGEKSRDTTMTITDERTVSELKAMHDALQIQGTQRPMETDRFVLTFYWKGETAWTWYVAASGDDGAVVTSSSLRMGNYTVENEFDYDRLAELSEGQQMEARDGTVLLSDLISSGVSSVKVNGWGKTVELSESELADFFAIAKEIEYRIGDDNEKNMIAAPGAITITITVQYLDGESEQFTLPYCLHEGTLYIAPAQSIAAFSHYFA